MWASTVACVYWVIYFSVHTLHIVLHSCTQIHVITYLIHFQWQQQQQQRNHKFVFNSFSIKARTMQIIATLTGTPYYRNQLKYSIYACVSSRWSMPNYTHVKDACVKYTLYSRLLYKDWFLFQGFYEIIEIFIKAFFFVCVTCIYLCMSFMILGRSVCLE